VIIDLPWPPKELSPNARVHWRKLRGPNGIATKYHDDCFWLSEKAIPRSLELPDGKIPIKVEFFPPDNRHRDDDNIIASFKHGRDGLADALQVNDRRFVATYIVRDKVAGGAVVVTL